MKFPRSKFAVYCVLVSSWLAFCCADCGAPMDDFGKPTKYSVDVCAQQPAGVDSIEMRVTYQAGDSVWEGSTSTVSKYGFFDQRNMACLYCGSYCDSLFTQGRTNKISVGISFYCADKKISLPTYVIDSASHRWGEDDINYRFVEFDERKINGEYTVETFLPPNDTSCGKFVNYAVLRLP